MCRHTNYKPPASKKQQNAPQPNRAFARPVPALVPAVIPDRRAPGKNGRALSINAALPGDNE